MPNRITRFIAHRILPPDLAKQYDTLLPGNFQSVVPPQEQPPGSGVGYIFSPYVQFYTKVFGVVPIADLTKYRLMYRTQPDIQGRVNVFVNMAVGKGFTIKCDEQEGQAAAQWLQDWADDIDLHNVLVTCGYDARIYGNAYLELIWDKMQSTQVTLDPDAPQETVSTIKAPLRAWTEEHAICDKCNQYTLYGVREIGPDYVQYGEREKFLAYKCENPNCNNKSEVNLKYALGMPIVNRTKNQFTGQETTEPLQTNLISMDEDRAKSIVNLKPLDPIYMRVRADSFGNVFGYFQWLSWPPVLFSANAVIHYRWNPQSWGYETVYGTGILMPLIKNNDLLTQYENDMAVWVHTYAKPMLDVTAGSLEQPFTDPQLKAEVNRWAQRTPGTDVIHRHNIALKYIKGETAGGGAAGGALTPWQDYLLTRRKEVLGVPDVLMGYQAEGRGGSNRSIGTVTMEVFIVEAERFQNFLAKPFEHLVFPALLKANGFTQKVEVAGKTGKIETKALYELHYRVIWKPIFEEDPNTRSQRGIDLRKNGVISVNELRSQLPDTQPIPQSDSRYKSELDDPTYPPPAPSKTGDGDQGEASSELAPTDLTQPEGPAEVDYQAQTENKRRVEAKQIEGLDRKRTYLFDDKNRERYVAKMRSIGYVEDPRVKANDLFNGYTCANCEYFTKNEQSPTGFWCKKFQIPDRPNGCCDGHEFNPKLQRPAIPS